MKPVLPLVDDHEDILHFLATDLSELNRIETASNGSEALKVLEQTGVHLVVSDVLMPPMDGFVLCREIKFQLLTYSSDFAYSKKHHAI